MKLSLRKKKEPNTDRLTMPWSTTQVERYRRIENELHRKGMDKLHDLSRARLEALLDEVEEALKTA